LKPVVDSLIHKGLMIALTPPGRGQVVSHKLYKERELAELKTRFQGYVPTAIGDDEAPPLVAGTAGAAVAAHTGARVSPPRVTADQFAELSVEVAELRAEVARLKDQLQQLQALVQ
jgi:uncharacterized protein